MSMQQFLEAIQSGAPGQEIAALPIPESYRAAHVLRAEQEMWAGVDSDDKDPRKSLHVGEVPTPELAPDEVFVAPMASSINFNTVWTSIFEPLSTFMFLDRLGKESVWGKRHQQDFHVVGSDAAGVVLFHLRGVKKLWVYPTDEAHQPQESIEKVIMRVQAEELPYRMAFDQDAQVVELQPGQALTWPLYAPHRVENQGVFNVSLSLDFQTWETRLMRGAHYANGVVRRLGMTPAQMNKTPAAARAALWASSLAMKKLNVAPNLIKDYKRSFDLSAQERKAA